MNSLNVHPPDMHWYLETALIVVLTSPLWLLLGRWSHRFWKGVYFYLLTGEVMDKKNPPSWKGIFHYRHTGEKLDEENPREPPHDRP